MRARQSVLFSLCASILVISAACSDAANPILGPDGPVVLNSSKTVVIAPSQATLAQGSHVALQVRANDSNGQPVSGSVTWSSSDTNVAKVSNSGDVVAVAPGQAMITAHVGDIQAQATVEVSGSTAPGPSDSTAGASPTSPGGSSLWAHEPSGMTTLTDQEWNSIASQGWQEFDPNNHISTVSDASVPTEEAKVLQFAYPAGYSGGGYGPGQLQFHMSKGEMYIGFYWKMSPNWQGHTSSVNKLMYFFQQRGNDRQALVLEAYGQPGGPYHVRMANEPDHSQWIDQNVSNVRLEPGTWHKIEVHLKRSSAEGAPDGVVEWWVDGQLAAQYTNARLRSEPFSEVHIDPVWGGVDNSISKVHDDYFRFGRMHVSGR